MCPGHDVGVRGAVGEASEDVAGLPRRATINEYSKKTDEQPEPLVVLAFTVRVVSPDVMELMIGTAGSFTAVTASEVAQFESFLFLSLLKARTLKVYDVPPTESKVA